jgi:hypothetical protein
VVWLAQVAQVEADPRARVLRSGDDLLWTIQAGQELLDGQSQIQCHVDDEGMVDLGRYGKIRLAGLTLGEAKLALENHIAGQAPARGQAAARVSDLPAPPPVAAGFLLPGPSLCALAKNQAEAGISTRPPEVRMVQLRPAAAPDPVTTPITPGSTDVNPVGIDRMIFEHIKVARSSDPRTSDCKLCRRAENSALAVSAAQASVGDQRINQVRSSPYHPLETTPVCQASYNEPDPFPSVVDAPAHSVSQPKPSHSQSKLVVGWHHLCDTVNSIHFPMSSAPNVR